MERENLIQRIWSEKRGRKVITEVYPLGLLITLDEVERTLNEIVFGILCCLLKSPEQGIEWAKHWGRSIIQFHSCSGFDFRFTMRKDLFEKRGVMLSTEVLHDPTTFINQSVNQGRYTIILNGEPMLYEGIVLAVERMVDELVWCRYQDFLSQNGTLSEAEIYRLAVKHVLDQGVSIECSSEDYILTQKQLNPNMPVRIYGKMYKEVKIPTIIGCIVDQGPSFSKEIRGTVVKAEPECQLVAEQAAFEKFGHDDLVCVSLIPAKPLHFGHLLHFVHAEQLRRSLGINHPIMLESNDVGNRVIRLVDNLAEVEGITHEAVIKQLCNDQIDEKKLHMAYMARDAVQNSQVNSAHKFLKRNNQSLFGRAERGIREVLSSIGINVDLVKDSECQAEFDELYTGGKNFLGNCGFRSIRYATHSGPAMIVVQKAGLPTAPAMRSCFLFRLKKRMPDARQILFVDSDVSVQLGVMLASLKIPNNRYGLMSGTGISIGFEPGSGTKGNLPTAAQIIALVSRHEIKESELFGFFSFFTLTRSLTTRGHKEQPLAKGSPIGQEYHDYADLASLYADLEKSVYEYVTFRAGLSNVMIMLNDVISDAVEVEERGVVDLTLKIRHEKSIAWLNKAVHPTTAISLESNIRRFREVVHLNNQDKSPAEIDMVLVSGFLSDSTSEARLAFHMREAGYFVPAAVSKGTDPMPCVFYEDLKKRGYEGEQLRENLVKYFSGEWILSFRKLWLFEMIKSIIRLAPKVKTKETASLFFAVLQKYSAMLGFKTF